MSTTLTKVDVVQALCEQLTLNRRDVQDVVDAFFNEIHMALVEGDDVKLSGFGSFQLRDKAARPGRNPKTGEAFVVSARRVVTFHASRKLIACVKESMSGRERSTE